MSISPHLKISWNPGNLRIHSFLFLVSAIVQIWLGRHHRREKRYGPSPSNNYTSGKTGRKFWVRKPKTTTTTHHDTEKGHVHGAHSATTTTATTTTAPLVAGGIGSDGHHDIRPSGDTGYTGSTMAPPNSHYNKYEGPTNSVPTHTGYYSAPTGTAVNPYGYDNTTRGTATNY